LPRQPWHRTQRHQLLAIQLGFSGIQFLPVGRGDGDGLSAQPAPAAAGSKRVTGVTAGAEQATVPAGDLDTSRWVVVIPSFNHADDAINCLQSLYDADDKPNSVIFVDDASTDGAVETIAAWAARSGISHEIVDPMNWRPNRSSPKWLAIVASKQNSGFSASCNLGLRHVRDHTDAPFALLLNNDAAVSRTYFRDLARGLAATGNPGLATG